MEPLKEKVDTTGQMVETFKDNGAITKPMASVHSSGQTGKSMLVIL